ncbi:MAG: undecaprenyldiphospho-muramoylpentapeptide beta-N-acetylglucosaminyltransferase [Schlesneria sp.]|nr:undecaprenyldiphospho-muramoylpentapeptide beta-N-acetylglucosaminyltransferase [Schlesneria sp.]
MATKRTYLFAGGGTGGHLFPGIAVALELLRREPDCRVMFIGSEKDLESSILARYQLEHRPLPVESLSALKRRPLRFVFRNWRAWRAAKGLIRETSPTIVIGLGGYASAPVVWAAARASVPIVLLEQNVIPGRTTRWLASSAAVVCTSFAEATDRLPTAKRVEVTGNPVRQEISRLAQEVRQPAPRMELLVLGGSQGADSLNEAVMEAVGQVGKPLVGWRIVHQTGPRLADSVRLAYQQQSVDAEVRPFFDDMAARYRAASVVISRAGATTIAELTCCGLPMVLVPYQHAADDHQRANANSLQTRGAAIVIEHGTTTEDTAQRLTAQLHELLADESLRQRMSDAAKQLSIPDAASRVVDQIQALANC